LKSNQPRDQLAYQDLTKTGLAIYGPVVKVPGGSEV